MITEDIQVESDEGETLMTDKELDAMAFHLPHVKAWVTAVEAQLFAALERGVKFENAYLTPKRADRKWSEFILDDEGQPTNKRLNILARLKKFSRLDVIAPRKVLSPAQVEKALGRSTYSEIAKGCVVKESSGMKLAYTHPEETSE